MKEILRIIKQVLPYGKTNDVLSSFPYFLALLLFTQNESTFSYFYGFQKSHPQGGMSKIDSPYYYNIL